MIQFVTDICPVHTFIREQFNTAIRYVESYRHQKPQETVDVLLSTLSVLYGVAMSVTIPEDDNAPT